MKKIFPALLFLTLLGLIASGIMVKMHLDLAPGGFESKSFCTISEFVDCDTALASRYSKIAGIPTAQIGLLYYLFFFFATLYAWSSEKGRRATASFLLAGSLFATGYSLVIAYLSIFRLEVLCLLCLTTYLCNFFHLILLPRILGIPIWRIPAHLMEYARSLLRQGSLVPGKIGLHLILFGLLLGGGLIFFKGLQANDPVRKVKIPDELYLKHFYATPSQPLGITPKLQRGEANAPVTLIEFSDFQCPFCRRAAFSLKPFLGELKKNVRIVYLNYPLDNACNPAVSRSFHMASCLSAKAALCAEQKGKFWEYHDLVFENQKKLSRETLMKLAKEVGIEEEWFNQCLVSPEIETELSAEIQEGQKFGVQGTPAIFINGRPFHDWINPERLRLVVRSEIEKVTSSSAATNK
ncbi:MAG: thioredoxin domain-containing protein [Deltaproteobacteria bacterium]|nr:thioredoxin domain-containing protein [Deltaproteobacteria bacterium]